MGDNRVPVSGSDALPEEITRLIGAYGDTARDYGSTCGVVGPGSKAALAKAIKLRCDLVAAIQSLVALQRAEAQRDTERKWCLAILGEGPDAVQRITTKFNGLRDGSIPMPNGWGALPQGEEK